MRYLEQLFDFKIVVGKHLLSTYYIYIYTSLGWEMEVLKFIMNKFYSLLSKEFPVLWGRQISTEIIQKGKKGGMASDECGG